MNNHKNWALAAAHVLCYNARMLGQPARVDPIIASFAPIIQPHCRIIDIGAGKGLLAQEMVRQLSARVTLVDVAQYNHSNLPLTVSDSRFLAFADDSFDYALLSFVLHHSPKPELILGEALRVAHRVVIIENIVRGRIRGAVTRMIDSWPAIRYGTPPCHFVKTREEWMDLLGQYGKTRLLKEFELEFGFFQCFTVELVSDIYEDMDVS